MFTVPLYIRLLKTHLEYCLQLLYKEYNGGTKMIPALKQIPHEDKLNQCLLTTLETRRIMDDQTEVFIIMHGYKNTEEKHYYQMAQESTH